jgi:hypothetical protein
MLGLRIVLLGAPTSLSRRHHGDRTAPHRRRRHVRRRSSEAGQREHMVWQGIRSQLENGLSFCALVAISPRRAKLRELGGVPRGVRSNDTPPPIPAAGAPPAGPCQELIWQFVPPAASGCKSTGGFR